jgi:hypothetical protein
MVSLMAPQNKIEADYSLTVLQLFDRVAGRRNLDYETVERLSIKLGLGHADR